MKILFVLDHDTFGDKYIDIASKVAPYCEMIWYRIKNVRHVEIVKRALALRNALPSSTLILSIDPQLAAAAQFDGVQLNAGSASIEFIKSQFPTLLIGYSAHFSAECALPADYFTLSPIFPTNKPFPVVPLGAIPAPTSNVYALGGINANNISTLFGLGYAGAAGISFHNDIETIFSLAHSASAEPPTQ